MQYTFVSAALNFKLSLRYKHHLEGGPTKIKIKAMVLDTELIKTCTHYKVVVEGIEHNASTVLICVAWSTSVSCHGKSSQ
jgi:hypothetical protein